MDRDHKLQKSGVIYRFKCPHINCPEEHIGESGRTFGDRLKAHLRVPPFIHHHSHSTGHPVSPECFTIVDGEWQGVTRNIKEPMYICFNDPSHMGQSFPRHTCTPAQIAQLYHPHAWAKPYPTIMWEVCAIWFGKYCPMWGCLPFHPYCCHNTAHTPKTWTPHTPQNPLNPYFSGTIFGK